MKITFAAKGFAELEKALAEELPKATARNVLRRAGLAAMDRVEKKGQALAPKREGDLTSRIETKVIKARRASRARFERSTGVEVATGPTGRREEGGNAAWQEFGTVNMPANPYMRPAADSEGPAVINDVREELTMQVEKAKARIARKTARAGRV